MLYMYGDSGRGRLRGKYLARYCTPMCYSCTRVFFFLIGVFVTEKRMRENECSVKGWGK